jgi:hypothetical protein
MERLSAVEGLDNFHAYWNSPNSFMPKVEFDNAKEYSQIEADSDLRKYPRIETSHESTMKWTMRFVGTFRTTFDLTMFPFDSQQLAIKMRFRRQGKIARVRAVPSAFRETKLAVEDVEKTDMLVLPHLEMRGGEYGPTTHFSVRVFVQRAWRRYLWNIVCINFALAVMGWCVLIFTPPTQTAVRHDAILNLLLTSVAFKFAVNDDLPKLPFLTALDWYVLLNFFFLFLHAVETWVVGAIVVSPSSGRNLIFSNYAFSVQNYHESDLERQRHWELKAQNCELWFIRILGTIWLCIQVYVFRFAFFGIRKMNLQRVYSEAMGAMNKARAKTSGVAPEAKVRKELKRQISVHMGKDREEKMALTGVSAIAPQAPTSSAKARIAAGFQTQSTEAFETVGLPDSDAAVPSHDIMMRRVSFERVGLPVRYIRIRIREQRESERADNSIHPYISIHPSPLSHSPTV